MKRRTTELGGMQLFNMRHVTTTANLNAPGMFDVGDPKPLGWALQEQGIRVGQWARAELGLGLVAVVHGTSTRHVRTAQAFVEGYEGCTAPHSVQLIEDARNNERQWAPEVQGRSKKEIFALPEVEDEILRVGYYDATIFGGETVRQVADRTEQMYQEYACRYTGVGRFVVFVQSGQTTIALPAVWQNKSREEFLRAKPGNGSFAPVNQFDPHIRTPLITPPQLQPGSSPFL